MTPIQKLQVAVDKFNDTFEEDHYLNWFDVLDCINDINDNEEIESVFKELEIRTEQLKQEHEQ